jgi:hypothetical protein
VDTRLDLFVRHSTDELDWLHIELALLCHFAQNPYNSNQTVPLPKSELTQQLRILFESDFSFPLFFA